MISPSDVTYISIRDWNNITKRSLIFLLEGLIGASLIEHFYPCGSHSEIFRYIGWMCLTSLILSVTLMTLISDLLHPNHLLTNDKAFNRTVCKTVTLLACTSLVASLVFGLTKQRSSAETWALIVAISTHLLILGIVIVVIRLFALPSKKKNSGIETAEKSERSDDTSCCVAFCYQKSLNDTTTKCRKSCNFGLCCPSYLYDRVPNEVQKKDRRSSNAESSSRNEIRLSTARATTSEGVYF